MRRFFFVCLCILFSVPVMASQVVTKYIPDAKQVGSGSLSIMFWEVYDATLYAPDGVWDRAKPFALSINYKRNIDGADIADRSVEEIRKLGYKDEAKLAAWHSKMRDFFPDVAPGTTLIGFYAPGQPTVFYHEGARIGAVQDPEFGKWFFDIWLSQDSSEPSLRSALLGQ